MASPCKNCGCEHDQCMSQPCPDCGHSEPNRFPVFNIPDGTITIKDVYCKICKKNHTVTKFVEKLMVKNVE